MSSSRTGLPRVAVVFAPRGAATLRDIAVAAHGAVQPVLVIPEHVADTSPHLVKVARRWFPEVAVDPTEFDSASAVDGVLTFHDGELETVDRIRAWLGLADLKWAQKADKLWQREILRRAGLTAIEALPVHAQEEMAAAAGHLGYPFVVKPRRGVGGHGVTIVADRAGIPAGPMDGYLAETFIPARSEADEPGSWMADFISVEVCSVASRHTVMAIFGKLPVARLTGQERERLQTTGDVLPWQGSPEQHEEVRELVVAALDALAIRWGVTHTEVKLGRDGPEIIEVNCRLGGHLSRLTRRGKGIDMVQAALLTAAAIDPALPESVPAREAALGVFIPFPDRRGKVLSDVSASALARLPGVCAVEEIAQHGSDRAETDAIAANVMLHAPGPGELKAVLLAYLEGAARLFAQDGVGATGWFAKLTAALGRGV